MASKPVEIVAINELRQNTEEGSTLEVIFNIKDSGLKYKTA